MIWHVPGLDARHFESPYEAEIDRLPMMEQERFRPTDLHPDDESGSNGP